MGEGWGPGGLGYRTWEVSGLSAREGKGSGGLGRGSGARLCTQGRHDGGPVSSRSDRGAGSSESRPLTQGLCV